MLPFVVHSAATIDPIAIDRQRPRIAIGFPLPLLPVGDITVTIGEHRRQTIPFATMTDDEWPGKR